MEETQEIDFGTIRAPGIPKTHKKSENSKVDTILRRLSVISNSIQTNFRGLGMLNTDLTALEKFKNFLNEKFLQLAQTTELRRSRLQELKAQAYRYNDKIKSYKEINEVYKENIILIEQKNNSVQNLIKAKENEEENAKFLRNCLLKLTRTEDDLKRASDSIKFETTKLVIEKNYLLIQKGNKIVNDLIIKTRSIQADNKEVNLPQVAVQGDRDNKFLLLLGGILIILFLIKLNL
jgi:hypothetical protein